MMQSWFEWAEELGGAKNHTTLLLRGATVPNEMEKELYALAGRVYGKVDVLQAFYEDDRPWPVNANLMYQRAARHVSENIKTYWAWCEPDCIPLAPNWWDLWEREYQLCGKPYMGCIVENPHHLTGNAIYPAHVEKYSANVLLTELVAWDVVDTEKIIPVAHHSVRYCHKWHYNVPPQDPKKYSDAATHFGSLKDLEIIPEHALLFHRNKDGSLIERLRERKSGVVVPSVAVSVSEPPPAPKPEPVPEPAPVPPKREPLKCSILVRTYRKDAAWLRYSLSSIAKYAHGFLRCLVVAPKPDKHIILPICHQFGFDYRSVEPDPCDGYLAQQITKLKADEYLPEADFILHHDSDTLFKMPSSPEDFISRDGGDRPIILMQDYATFDGEKMPWQKPTEVALGSPVQFEFMRRHPLVYPRWLYQEGRRHLKERFGIPWDEWVGAQIGPDKGFSEFNFLGALAYQFHRDKFVWVDVKREKPSPDRVHQFWSWGGMTAETKAKIAEILGT